MYFTVPAQTELLALSTGARERSSAMRATHTHLDWPQVRAPLACPSCQALASGPLRRLHRGSGPVTQRLRQPSRSRADPRVSGLVKSQTMPSKQMRAAAVWGACVLLATAVVLGRVPVDSTSLETITDMDAPTLADRALMARTMVCKLMRAIARIQLDVHS